MMKFFYICFLAVILISSCSNLELSRKHVPLDFLKIMEIDLDYSPVKFLFSSLDNTIFVWQKDTSQIHLYRAGKLINTIGKIESERGSFNQLSDITLSPDGNLLTLDSMQKQIRKYDRSGKFIFSVELPEFIQPQLFDITSDETFYIYDSFLNEVIITRDFRKKNWFSFGNQEISKPSQLSAGINTIILSSQQSSLIFNIMGKPEASYNEFSQIDRGVFFSLQKNHVLHPASGKRFAQTAGQWHNFLIKNGFVLLTGEKNILIGKFIYETN